MPQLIEVAFKGNRREFFRWEADDLPPLQASVIVDADRGEDLGVVHSTGDAAERRSARVPHGLFGAAPARTALRLAAHDEVRQLVEVRADDEDARRRAMERVRANALVMKLTDAEWQWDRKKLTLYFTAEKRVDFRTLVRELASMFRTRIELKQIGVRDEAKRLDGIGRCGRQYCSASWLPELRPVNLGVAKDQRLSLNPSQISGACGRLMCCLRYEHDFYVASRRKYPKELKIVRTSRGEEKVVANDIFRERVTLRGVDGESRTVPLVDLRAEMTDAGDPLAAALEAASRETYAAPVTRTGAHEHDLDGETGEFAVPVTRRPAPRREPPASAGHSAASRPARLRTERTERPARAAAPVSPAPLADAAPDSTPTGEATGAADDDRPDADADETRRAPRRRGRRGGRRNRPGGAPGGADEPGTPPRGA